MISKLVYKLDNTIQYYAWGSKSSFSEILGIPNPDGKAMAELWMGAHPKAPSMTEEGSLSDLIASAPDFFLGEAAAARFGGKLPFLFKVLAAGAPLSIQSHPSLSQAKEGFARENSAGIALDAFKRNYKDDNHKPEILCALTAFTAMWGFRAPAIIREEFEELKTDAAVPLLKALKARDDKEALKYFLKTLMGMDKGLLESLIEKALAAAGSRKDVQGEWIQRFSELYPGDPGILSPLYLNILNLSPGQAIYIPAGELHAYLDGTGIELMANSDNVLRGGLTPKHVDVPELLSVLTFAPRTPEFAPCSEVEGVRTYPVPAEEFILKQLKTDGSELKTPFSSAQILICLDGQFQCEVGIGSDTERFTLQKGESFFLAAAGERLLLKGAGEVFTAGIPSVRRAGKMEA